VTLARNMYQSLGHEHFEPRLQDAVFKGDPFLHYVKENQAIQIRGGLAIRLGQVIQEGVFESFDRGDNATLEVREPFNSAQAEWHYARATAALYETDILENDGEDGVIDLVSATRQWLEQTMTENLSDILMGSNSSNSKQSPGNQDLFGASGTSYLGLLDTDLSSPASWLSSIVTPLTANTFNANEARRMRGAVTRGGSKPNLGACNFPMYNRIWKEAQDDQRFGMEDAANLGFDTVYFEKMPIIADEHAPGSGYGSTDNWLMFFNMDHIKFYVHPKWNFKVRSYDPLPQQEALIWKVLLAYSYATDARRTHAVCKVFNPSL